MNIDRYGLSAQYEFSVSNESFTSMDRVLSSLNKITAATQQTEKAIAGVKIGKQFEKASNEAVKSASKVAKTNGKLQNSLKNVNKQLRPIKQEFAAITAEARNIEWGDLLQPGKFRQAKKQTQLYIYELEKLEKQVSGNTAVERKLMAQLKRKQTIMKGQIELQKQERAAAAASNRIGEGRALAAVGRSVIMPFNRIVGDGVRDSGSI